MTLCVRIPDGQRTEVTLPTSHPLSSLVATALCQLRGTGAALKGDRGEGLGDIGVPGGQGWVLGTSEVPKTEFVDLSLSLQEAGLTSPRVLHLTPSS